MIQGHFKGRFPCTFSVKFWPRAKSPNYCSTSTSPHVAAWCNAIRLSSFSWSSTSLVENRQLESARLSQIEFNNNNKECSDLFRLDGLAQASCSGSITTKVHTLFTQRRWKLTMYASASVPLGDCGSLRYVLRHRR